MTWRNIFQSKPVPSQRGASAVEYAFIAALIIIPLIAGTHLLRQESTSVIVEGGKRSGTPAEYSEGAVIPP